MHSEKKIQEIDHKGEQEVFPNNDISQAPGVISGTSLFTIPTHRGNQKCSNKKGNSVFSRDVKIGVANVRNQNNRKTAPNASKNNLEVLLTNITENISEFTICHVNCGNSLVAEMTPHPIRSNSISSVVSTMHISLMIYNPN